MYLKLALRNARRSAGEQRLTLATLVVLAAIMDFSNLLSVASGQQSRVQANSLPALIALILVILLGYLNQFVLRQRAKEFATYILLGMERRTLARLFFAENAVLAFACFALGTALGSGLFCLAGILLPQTLAGLWGPAVLARAAGAAFCWLLVIEGASLLLTQRQVRRLSIAKLLQTGRQNESTKGTAQAMRWALLFAVSAGASLALLWCIATGSEKTAEWCVSVVSAPLLLAVAAFYKAGFYLLALVRQKRRGFLYAGDRLYVSGQLLARVNSRANLSAALAICLLLSACSFITGMALAFAPVRVMPPPQQRWMAFVQVCICVIFMVLYFSILAVQQTVEARQGRAGQRLLFRLGKTPRQLRELLQRQIHLRFLLPAAMCAAVLALVALAASPRLAAWLGAPGLLWCILAGFAGCYGLLYAGYFALAYRAAVAKERG